uniref:Protein kinase domain-containing protein n=1 Tax=Bursaphelenchus xylophilus TaxID=6326 RepID=A0A1I7RX37_BURXY
MDLGKVATIIQALNACEVLFGDVKPNRFEVKSFKVTEGQIELFATKDNAASFETVPINYTGSAIHDIRLQMSIQGNKTIVGGQVTIKTATGLPNCAVIGDDKELKQVAGCNAGFCIYLFGDAVYRISDDPSEYSRIFKKPGEVYAEIKQPNITCAHRFGVDDVKRAFYFKKNGTCMHEFFDGFQNPWSPVECDSFVPITLEPDTPSQFYHLRHLMIVTGCEMPRLITENMIDNTFIQFTFIDTSVTTTISTSTTIDEAAEMRLLALVAGCVGGGTLLVLVATLIVVFLKCLGINICCCKKKKKVAPKKAPPVPVRRPPQPYDLYPEYSMDEKTKSIKAEPKLPKGEVRSLGLETDNYMQRSPYSNACILCDFGLARRFGCKRGGAEGSADYMSVASHTHQRVTLLDDMQSWLITLIAIFRQDLPWRLEGNPRINSKGEESETGLHTDQADYRDKLFLKNLYFESVGRSSVQDTVICDLAEMIWFKGRRDMIRMQEEVVA